MLLTDGGHLPQLRNTAAALLPTGKLLSVQKRRAGGPLPTPLSGNAMRQMSHVN
jgi:hypothetical protein